MRLEATTKVVDQRDSTLLIEYQNHATSIDDQVRRTCGGPMEQSETEKRKDVTSAPDFVKFLKNHSVSSN